MIQKLFNFFRPPVFPKDEDKTRIAGNASTIALTIISLILLYEAQFAFSAEGRYETADFLLLGFAGLLTVYWLLIKYGHVRIAGLSMVTTFWLLTTVLAYTGNGVRDTAFMVNFVILLIASLLLGWQESLAFAILSIIAGFGLVALENNGFLVSQIYPPFSIARDFAVLLVMSAVFLYLLVSNFKDTLNRTRSINTALQEKSDEYNRLQNTLQQRSVELERRSIDLEMAIQQNTLRTSEFEIISQITRASTSIEDTENLLPRTAELISQRFGFYHTGIFILDDTREYAILQAVNKEGRKQLLERGYKLKVEPYGGLVATAAATGIPRIASDIEENSAEFNATDYPDSRSEMTIPIKTGEHTIGVIDLHSELRNAFDASYFEVFSILADQLAVAVQNTKLFRESQAALAESRTLYSTVVQQAWHSNIQTMPQIGYRYTGANSHKLENPIGSPEALAALDRGEVVLTSRSRPDDETTLAVPLKLRGEIIGVINVKLPAEFEAGDDEIDIVEATASRIAVALENSTLLEDSQRRAIKERTIGEISAKIGGLVNLENILETAIQELGMTLPNTEIAIQFASADTGQKV